MCDEKELAVRRSRILYLESVTAEPEFAERTQWWSKLPSRRKANKKRPRASSRDGPAPKRKCSTRSKVGSIFMSGTTASLIREAFPNQKGVVVLKTAPVAKNLFDMSLDEILSDVEWEPTIVELLTSAVSLVVGDPEKELEREDPVEPEPVPDMELEKEKTLIASGSRCKRSTTPGRSKRKPNKRSKPRTQDMILEGLYCLDESLEDGCLLLGLTRNIIDLD